MPDQAIFIHYATISGLFVLPALATAIGQGLTAKQALRAISAQPAAAADISRNFVLGSALNETATILNGIMVLLLLIKTYPVTMNSALGQLGIFCALGIPSICIGILSILPHQAAITATARQPFFAKNILKLMLITISLMQTSAILGLIIAFLIQAQLATVNSFTGGIQLLAAGIALGVGTIGPLIGLGIFSQEACATIGTNKEAYPQVLTFTFINQALIETPIIFALLVAILIIFSSGATATVLLAAAFAMAFSTLGPGIASGMIARATCRAFGKQLDLYSTLSRTSMFAQTLIDASAIYGLVIAFALLFFA